MPDIEIKRGYVILPDNNVKFGIKVINNSNYAISNVEVLLDYTESLFELSGGKIKKLGTIPPTVPRTAEFIMEPLGCIHKENIGAMIIYKDHTWTKRTLEMRTKEVHCVCPFLKEKPIKRADFLKLSNSGYKDERGINFEGISIDKLVELLEHTCKNRLYKVDDFQIDNGKILYLAGDAVGEKAYYLLTAVIKESEGIVQVFLRASSDKSHGLSGFLNEIVDNLRHLVMNTSAKEIGIIKKEYVVNIIDSIVKDSNISVKEAEPQIKTQSIQNPQADELRVKREQKDVEKKKNLRKSQDVRREKKRTSYTKYLAMAILFVVIMFGYIGLMNLLDDSPQSLKSTPLPTPTVIQTPEPTPIVTLASIQKNITNSIGMEFILIPSGEFDMGSPSNEEGRYDDENPLHHVKFANAFYMGKYEVTQKQWFEVMGNNPSSFKGDNLPVEKVTWNDVQDFIIKLNEKERGNKYRLPTEAEWEYAIRAGTTTRYSFGDDDSILGEYAWYWDISGSKTHEVGQKKPNPWGLYDMHGNVGEWVQDKYHDDYNGAPIDGSEWEGSGSNRVNRGGCWNDYARSCRSAYRDYADQATDRNFNLGFRLVRSV